MKSKLEELVDKKKAERLKAEETRLKEIENMIDRRYRR